MRTASSRFSILGPLQALGSSDPALMARGIVELDTAADEFLEILDRGLHNPATRFLLAEHLASAGQRMVKCITSLATDPVNDRQTRTLAGLLSLGFGSTECIPVLVEAVRLDPDLSGLVAHKLLSVASIDLAAIVEAAVLTVPIEEPDRIASLLDVLRRLGRPPPSALVERLVQAAA
jgi:hypothetical protein